jgi:DNA-directed RNA polymerase specialized sigma subunit
MEEEKFLTEELVFIKKLSLYYAWKFSLDKDDLFQEGCLATIMMFRKYGNSQNKEAIEKIAKKVSNRAMYRFIKRELDRRKVEEEIHDLN